MIHLSNGCKCSEPKVNPANWESSKASLKKNWFIYYRFYDPSVKDKYPKGKLRVIKGMNDARTLEERRAIVRALIELELNELKNLGYNPILEKHITPTAQPKSLTPNTPLIEALRAAFEKAGFVGRTYTDIKSVLKYVEQASVHLRFDYLSAKEVRPSHILLVLEQCGKIKDTWTANTYNVYIKYLSILFGQLLQHQAVEFNPVRDIKKKKTVKNIRAG